MNLIYLPNESPPISDLATLFAIHTDNNPPRITLTPAPSQTPKIPKLKTFIKIQIKNAMPKPCRNKPTMKTP